MQISIIIPVYNEVDNVTSLFTEIYEVLNGTPITFEVVFVDDGSTDGTKEILKSLSSQYSENLKFLFHKKNYGQSAALWTGAIHAKFDVLVTMDGDGQNDPSDIPQMLEQFQNNKVVLGIRKKRNDSIVKKVSSLVGNKVRTTVLNDGCKDTGCSLKIFPKQGFLSLPYFNHMHRYLPALFKNKGYGLVTINVNHRARQHGVSKYGVMNRLFVGVHDLFGVRWLLKRSCVPEVINE